jgi:osmotically-inducible protein OsmY
MSQQSIIGEEIRAAYTRDPRIPHPGEIAVAEQAGTVMLRGSVGSPHQRHAAAEIARSVRGVRNVENEITIDIHDHWDDDQLKGQALQALIAAGDAPADRITVDVDSAWVTLRGTVRHQAESNAAFAAISALPGVGGITNKITVVAPGGH